jgi:hypothetical protein
MLQITLLRRGTLEQVVELRHPTTMRIGRGAGNDIILRDPDKTVSRTHGQVRQETVGWVFIDNDSQNGSWVEGRRMDRVVLRDGVSVSFGDYELVCSDTTTPGAEDETRLGVSRADVDEAADDRTHVVPAGGGPVGLGPDDQTRLGSKIVPSRPPTGATPRPPAEATPRPPTVPHAHDETRPQPPPAPARRTAVDLQAETIVVPADLSAGLAATPPASAARSGAEELAETIVVPPELSAQLAAAPPLAPPQAPPRPAADELAETIVVPPELSAQLAAPPPAGPAQAKDQPPRMAPTFVTPPPAEAAETIVVPPEFAGPRASIGAGPTGTIHAGALAQPPAPRPAMPEADDATIAVPVDAEALLRDIRAHEANRLARADEQVTRLAPSPVLPPPDPAQEPPRPGEETPTVLMPGRPPTGQLAMPPRRSGEVPRPEVAPRPPTAPSIPAGPPAPPPVPAFEPPEAVWTPPATAVPPMAPPSIPAAGTQPTSARERPEPQAPWPTTPPAPAAMPPPAASVPVPPPAPAPPRVSQARAPASGSSFRPAVFIWAVAWLVLFGLIAAGVWLWASRSGSQSPAQPEAPPPAVQQDQPDAAPGAPAPPASEPVSASQGPAAPAGPPPTGQPAETPAAGAGGGPQGSASPAASPGAPAAVVSPAPSPRPAAPGGGRPASAPAESQAGTVAGIPREPGERPADYRLRVQEIERQYNAGRQALVAGRATEARDLFKVVAARAPAYKDVDGLLQDAEAAVRRQAGQELATAEKQEKAGEHEQAIASYRRAERLGAPAGEVTAAIQRVQRTLTAAGEKAFADAWQLDALGRNAEAVRLYQNAVRWLPDGHPKRAEAQQRLAVLGTRRP